MSEAGIYRVKAGDKVVEIDEAVLEVLQKYIHQEMSLEELAAKLGIEDWESAYDFVKNVPAWILWIPPSLWRTLRYMKSVQEEYTRVEQK